VVFKVARPPSPDPSAKVTGPETTAKLGEFHRTPLRAIILDEIRHIAVEHNKMLGSLEDEAPLLSIGLDSLGLAVLIVRLEETLKVDPFSGDDEVEFPNTLGELVRTYEVAVAASAS
jgi:acyl carrier protein